MESKKRSATTATALSILKGMHLHEVAVVKADVIRNIPSSEARRGSYGTEIVLEIKPGRLGKENGVIGIINLVLKGYRRGESEEASEDKEVAFSLHLVIEGFFIIKGKKKLLEDKELTDAHAYSVSAQLFPILVTYGNQYVASMGYNAATLSLGLLKIEQITHKH